MSPVRSGGRILVDQLVVHGAKLVFCVPGESYLAALDALYDTPQIRLIAGRMEASCANMACAHGQLTGQPGIFFASRGPGGAQASVAVHTAQQGSIPLIMFVGQVPRAHRGREAFQEVDIDAMFAPLAKWTATIDDPARIPEYVSRAYRVATAGRPGPVVLSLPEDVLTERADVPDRPRAADERPARSGPDTSSARPRARAGQPGRTAARRRRRWRMVGARGHRRGRAVRVLGGAAGDRVSLSGLRRQRVAGLLRHARPRYRPAAERPCAGIRSAAGDRGAAG